MAQQVHPSVPHPDVFRKDLASFDSGMVNMMAKVLGSTGFIWFCIVLDAIGFVALVQQTIQAIHTHQGVMTLITLWVAFIAQAVIQLIALPVLQNYQNRQSSLQEAKTEADHIALTHIATQVDAIAKATNAK